MTNKGTSIKVSGYKLPHPSLSALIALRTMFALRTFQLRRGRALPVTLFFFPAGRMRNGANKPDSTKQSSLFLQDGIHQRKAAMQFF